MVKNSAVFTYPLSLRSLATTSESLREGRRCTTKFENYMYVYRLGFYIISILTLKLSLIGSLEFIGLCAVLGLGID